MKGIKSSGFLPIIAQAITEMEEAYGEFSSLDQINWVELERRTGLSRSKLRRLKLNGFQETSRTKPQSKKEHILDGYSSVLNTMLCNGMNHTVPLLYQGFLHINPRVGVACALCFL